MLDDFGEDSDLVEFDGDGLGGERHGNSLIIRGDERSSEGRAIEVNGDTLPPPSTTSK